MFRPAVLFTICMVLFAPMAPRDGLREDLDEALSGATSGVSKGSGEMTWDLNCDPGDGNVVLPPGCWGPTPSSALDSQQTAGVAAAVRLFSDQGLRLPDLTFSFHDAKEGCNGHYGLYEPQRRHVRVCTEAAHVLPHELAHAWMVENLDDQTRQAFVEHRGLDAWADPNDEWRSRGVEDAAILMRMVLTENGGPSNSPGWVDRRQAFELLTGKAHEPTARNNGWRRRNISSQGSTGTPPLP